MQSFYFIPSLLISQIVILRLYSTDDVDGWHDSWARHYIPYVGGCLRGCFQNRQLDFLRIQLVPDFAIHVRLFYDESWYSGKYLNLYLAHTIYFSSGIYVNSFMLQLLVAQILSTAYAMIMMAVIVGTALQLGEDGIGSPSAIFLIALSSSFFIAACLHPQEFFCVVPGIIYLLSIPSMYLLLILYSIINLNVVSWGTREVQTKKTKKVSYISIK